MGSRWCRWSGTVELSTSPPSSDSELSGYWNAKLLRPPRFPTVRCLKDPAAVLADTGVNTPMDDFRSENSSVDAGLLFDPPHTLSNILDALDRTLSLDEERAESGVKGDAASDPAEDHAEYEDDRVCDRVEVEAVWKRRFMAIRSCKRLRGRAVLG